MNISILIFIVAIVSSFGLGVCITLFVQKQLAAVGGAAYILAFFGSVGAIDVIYSAIHEWRKKKNAPSLSFDGITMNKGLKDKNYSIKLSISQSSEEAKNCHAYLSLEGYDNTIITGWSDNSKQNMDIGSTGQLRLFTIDEEIDKKIWFFPMRESDEKPQPPGVSLPYSTFIVKELTIKIVCEVANPPSPYKKRISEIIAEGDKKFTLDRFLNWF
ncbi:MAG: hypothetical protein WAM14_09550 [Candidatus Nitrosopolaris sp.]